MTITIATNILGALIAFGIMIAYIVWYEFNLPFAFIMTTFAGITDAGISTTVLAILGFQFDSKTTPFSVFYLV